MIIIVKYLIIRYVYFCPVFALGKRRKTATSGHFEAIKVTGSNRNMRLGCSVLTGQDSFLDGWWNNVIMVKFDGVASFAAGHCF